MATPRTTTCKEVAAWPQHRASRRLLRKMPLETFVSNVRNSDADVDTLRKGAMALHVRSHADVIRVQLPLLAKEHTVVIPVDPTITNLPGHPYCLTFLVGGERLFRAFRMYANRDHYIEAVLRSCATEIALYELKKGEMPS
jgi:hypothetical protein